MALSAVSSAITTIGNLLAEEAKYLWGVEDEVERLQMELSWMQCFLSLKDADVRQDEDRRIRMWVSEIRELAYDAEDVVETFALKIKSKRKGGFSAALKRSALILREGPLLHETRSKIEKILARIADLTRRLQTYGIKELTDVHRASASILRREQRQSYPIDEDHIVGLTAEIKRVTELLSNDCQCKVVSVCGMGGLGKTTLAKKVFNNNNVRNKFDYFAWVYVSQQFQKRKVWEQILSTFNKTIKESEKKGDQEVAKLLSEFLKGNKCLVILDDVWSDKDWNLLSPAFPTEGSRSKILLTSRYMEVAKAANNKRTCCIHELKALKDDESWELFTKIVLPNTSPKSPISCWKLFQKIVFRNTSPKSTESTDPGIDRMGVNIDREAEAETGAMAETRPKRRERDTVDDSNLEALRDVIVQRCAGLPLAIIVLAGIFTKYSSQEWQKVYQHAELYWKRNTDQRMNNVLALSFEELPSYLRPCFLYLSVFPEDYEIPVNRLIQLWVAEGFVWSEFDEKKFVEDVAESYLIELVERFMIQVGERDEATLNIKTCRMHDLMRDLCLSKAKQENFLQVMDRNSSYSNCSSRTVRRIVTNGCPRVSIKYCDNLRSILCFDDQPVELVRDESCICFMMRRVFKLQGSSSWAWECIFNHSKLIRVLDFERWGRLESFKLLDGIGSLIHLRFLSFRDLNFGKNIGLPSSLGNLTCLQTLDLRLRGWTYVPNVLFRLEQLKHLYLPPRFSRRMYLKSKILNHKLVLYKLSKLQTLEQFNTEICRATDLSHLTSLRELFMIMDGSFSFERDFNKDSDGNPLKHLKSLSICFYYYTKIEIIDVALFLSSCPNLCKLRLIYWIPKAKLPEYRHFPSDIVEIILGNCELEEDPMPTLEKLSKLRILIIRWSAFIGKEMVCSRHAFPKLHSLTLDYLPHLEEWKVGEGAMPALHHLSIEHCRKLKTLPNGLKFIIPLQELKITRMAKEFKDKVEEGFQYLPSLIFQDIYEN